MDDNNLHKKIYSCLGLRNVSEKEYQRINNNINKFYNISDFSYFSPHIKLFTNFINTYKSLNNKFKLFELTCKKKRFGITGYCYNAKIKTSNNRIFHKKVFVKEIPLFDPITMELYYKSCNTKMNNISPVGQAVYNSLYNLNNQANIEHFVTYLTSKLYEENYSPHFCRFFGNYYTNLDKHTFDVSNSDTILEQIDELLTIDADIKYYESSEGIFLEYPNTPSYLLVTEYMRFSIDYLIENNILSYKIILSCVFQIFSAIATMISVFGLKHNDLHFGNIMVAKTEEKYLYYQFNNTYFKVPTYGYIFKIIDWGRSTYNFKKIIGSNNVFNGPGECFEQYIYPRINHSGLENIDIDNNMWTDLIMFSHSVLYEYKEYLINTDLQKFLTKIITATNKEQLELRQFDWDLYTEITSWDFDIKPRELFNNKIFNDFRIVQKNSKKKKTKIPKDINIYRFTC